MERLITGIVTHSFRIPPHLGRPFGLSLALCCFFYSVGCEWLETYESRYASLEEAIADGAVTRGWIPPFVPRSARDLRERHNIDTNEIWLAFAYQEGDLSVKGLCSDVADSNVQYPKYQRVKLEW